MGTKEKCAAGLLLIGDLCPLPADAAGDVGDLHALGLQLIADTVGLGEVFGLFRVVARLDLRSDGGIVAAILAEDGIRTSRRLFCCIALADLRGLAAKVQTQDLVEIVQHEQLSGVVRLVLEHVVERGDGQRGIEVVAESGVEFLTQGRDGGLVDLAVAWLQGGDLGQELLVGPGCVVEVFPREDQIAAVMWLCRQNRR